MKQLEKGRRLRILVGETDKLKGTPLYEVIVLKAREMNLSGASVFRGIMGFGAASRIHTVKVLRLSEDLPVMIEMVDTEENIEKLLPFLENKASLITLEDVEIVKFSDKSE